jgi:hypothetical protein
MDEIREKRTIIHEAPVGRQPVVETQYDHTVQEREGLSGGAIAAMVITGVIAAIFITWLIVNNQQSEDLAMERERALIAERNAAQAQAAQQQPQQQPQQQQQPNVIVLPQTQPSTVPVPVPVPAPSQAEPSSSISIEVDVNRKLLDDKQLGSYPITAKIENGTVTLSGNLPNEDLKTRAEKVVSSVKGVRRVINEIIVQ